MLSGHLLNAWVQRQPLLPASLRAESNLQAHLWSKHVSTRCELTCVLRLHRLWLCRQMPFWSLLMLKLQLHPALPDLRLRAQDFSPGMLNEASAASQHRQQAQTSCQARLQSQCTWQRRLQT